MNAGQTAGRNRWSKPLVITIGQNRWSKSLV
jgi:hypothetical protein